MKQRNALRVMVPLLSGLLLSPLLHAQDDPGGQSAQQEQAPAETRQQQDFDDETLEQFADAYVEVGEVHREYSERLQDTEATEDAQQLQQEANDKMVAAIEANGLEVQEYSAVAAALERDPELREEVVGMIEERQ
ncbi:DUF4168 domain-containing protein [Aquisalimonas lutea]|uniref:DUF4168 domain-containing protein n=1 Tax=Aquisalimonas lutea TaxID=1327750 RepID=UPI0025B2CCFB|nr:DUF4168 domain-containing protein [Aquisalimonas lutea]MDN3516187.1 DUF4168 domain-containing protein [Aquisalimonas lutea]